MSVPYIQAKRDRPALAEVAEVADARRTATDSSGRRISY
jgi:hypothetical protein